MRTIADLDRRSADSHYISKNSRYGDLLESSCSEEAKEVGHKKPYENAKPICIPKLKAKVRKESDDSSKK